jgi:tRNA pseudouridine13 synthase
MQSPDKSASLRCVIRYRPEDFRVEEIPVYRPSGAGPHLWVEIEKCGRTTDEVIQELGTASGVDPRSLGYAGRKDRHAITTQWLSLPRGGLREEFLADLQLPGIRILQVHQHAEKLRLGELRGNRFRVVVREFDECQSIAMSHEEALASRVDELSRRGMVNSFGPQRFGRRGDNASAGRDLLRGETPPRDVRLARFLISAWQSELFHAVLEERARMVHPEGPLLPSHWRRAATELIEGDILFDHSNQFFRRLELGGEEPGSEESESVRSLCASPTGPMFGPSMWRPRGAAGRLEEAVLRRHRIEVDSRSARKVLERLRLRGTRRALRVPVFHLSAKKENAAIPTLATRDDDRAADEGIARVFTFELPPGSYATVLLDQVYGEGVLEDAAGDGAALANSGRDAAVD